MMKNMLIILFLAFTYISSAQLIDPFGKIITHEIKMDKQEDGTYTGAIEWTTGGIDSIQRYIIDGLNVKAPVMVRIITKAPDHNIDLSFHKKNWEKSESKISTNGHKFVDKIFRTMNTAGLGVSSEVAGIPYLITVKVGLQFPSTESLIRITDDKEEYARHLRRKGLNEELSGESDNFSISTSGITNSNSGDGNTKLIYTIIGLLTIIILVLIAFLMKRKTTKNSALFFIMMCTTPFCIAQSNQPKLVPVPGQGESPIFYEYRTSNVTNQQPTPIDKPRIRDTSVDASVGDSGVFRRSAHIRIESNPGSTELNRR